MNAEYRGLSPLNILLAEDERAVAFSVAFALKCDGHKVQVVADGEQALASVRVEPDAFNLLITDHSMPGMTGTDLVQRLREQSFRGKIMVLSAHLSSENRAAYDALAVDAMVSKPFDVHELRATVTRLANWIGPVAGERPVRLSPDTLHDMLKTSLGEEEEPDDADQEALREEHDRDKQPVSIQFDSSDSDLAENATSSRGLLPLYR